MNFTSDYSYDPNSVDLLANPQSSTMSDAPYEYDPLTGDILPNVFSDANLAAHFDLSMVDDPSNLTGDHSLPLGMDTMGAQERVLQNDFASLDNPLYFNPMTTMTFNDPHLPIPMPEPDSTPWNGLENSTVIGTMQQTFNSNPGPVNSVSPLPTPELSHQCRNFSGKLLSITGVPQQCFENTSTVSGRISAPLERNQSGLSTHSTQPSRFMALRPKPTVPSHGAPSIMPATSASRQIGSYHEPLLQSALNSARQLPLPIGAQRPQRVGDSGNRGVVKVRKATSARSKPPPGVPSNSVVVWNTTSGSYSKKESWRRRPGPCLSCQLKKKRVSSALT